jgi:hypothetical protein
MSGPKVVRIVTREEIEAICRRHIAAVEEAVTELRRCAKRHDVLDDALTADLDKRLRQVRRLLAEGRLTELQKQAPLTVAFLKGETEQVRARAIAAAEAARSKRRRIADAARTLTSAIEASGRQPPLALQDVAKRASFADERDLAAMQTVLNENYAIIIASRQSPSTSKAQLELARRLRSDEISQTFPEWLAMHSATIDKRDVRLDTLMAEIETLDDPDTAQPFKERVAAIAAEGSAERRALLTDSLVLDLSERSRRRRADVVRAGNLREVQTGLRALGTPETRAMEAQIDSMLQSAVLSGADELVTQAQALIDREMAKLAATARRRAVLQGLAELGYEVRETMATAWARDGRLVIRKPGTTDYGVELGATADVSRLQVQLVGSERPAAARDAGRDRDMETIWCSEFSRLQDLLAGRGGELIIERALEAGAQPVKTVAFAETDREVRVAPRQMTRQE